MALTAQQLTYLKTSDQRFTAHVQLFNAYTPDITPAVAGMGVHLTPLPIPMCTPRYSTVANSGSITLYCKDSYNRGGGYVGDANVTIALHAGSSGSIVDNGDGTASYTAPAGGSGIAQIDITVTNTHGSKVGYAFVAYPKTSYDDVVSEVAAISGSINQKGWNVLLKIRGNASGFALLKTILIHVEDTWAGTQSTFGGYQYSEGVFVGTITDLTYFEDYTGETWLGVEASSPWWHLKRLKVGETYWGRVNATNRYWINNFAPVDAVWHFVNNLTNYTQYFNAVMWSDMNSVDDLIVSESDVGTIVEDLMARTLGITYCDRYGSLFCVPDPDVRADEYWGTPSSLFVMNENYVQSKQINYRPFTTRKLVLAAIDHSLLGIWGASEQNTDDGDIKKDGTLICDNSVTLAQWAVQKHAQLNRPWDVSVSLPLNHVVDINNFVDVVFTSNTQISALTASGQAYIDQISYRPSIENGSWAGNWHMLARTEGYTAGYSSWGGTGQYQPATAHPYTGDPFGSGGWESATGSAYKQYVTSVIVSGSAPSTARVTALSAQNSGQTYEVVASGWHRWDNVHPSASADPQWALLDGLWIRDQRLGVGNTTPYDAISATWVSGQITSLGETAVYGFVLTATTTGSLHFYQRDPVISDGNSGIFQVDIYARYGF